MNQINTTLIQTPDFDKACKNWFFLFFIFNFNQCKSWFRDGFWIGWNMFKPKTTKEHQVVWKVEVVKFWYKNPNFDTNLIRVEKIQHFLDLSIQFQYKDHSYIEILHYLRIPKSISTHQNKGKIDAIIRICRCCALKDKTRGLHDYYNHIYCL